MFCQLLYSKVLISHREVRIGPLYQMSWQQKSCVVSASRSPNLDQNTVYSIEIGLQAFALRFPNDVTQSSGFSDLGCHDTISVLVRPRCMYLICICVSVTKITNLTVNALLFFPYKQHVLCCLQMHWHDSLWWKFWSATDFAALASFKIGRKGKNVLLFWFRSYNITHPPWIIVLRLYSTSSSIMAP